MKWRVRKYRRVYGWPWDMPWMVICPNDRCAWEVTTWRAAIEFAHRKSALAHRCR